MIRLEMTANEGHMDLQFDVPDQPGEVVRLDELATFGLHLDIVKHRLVELMSRAVIKGEGYDLVVKD